MAILAKVSTESEKRGFLFPLFSMSYRHRKWRHILVPRETRIDQRFPFGGNRETQVVCPAASRYPEDEHLYLVHGQPVLAFSPVSGRR